MPHEHTDACYEEHRVLTCYQEEHEHTDDCFDEYGVLICGEFEHIHDDSCYTTEYELVCGLDEGELVEEPNPAIRKCLPSAPWWTCPLSRPRPPRTSRCCITTPTLLHRGAGVHHPGAPPHRGVPGRYPGRRGDCEEWQAAANVP